MAVLNTANIELNLPGHTWCLGVPLLQGTACAAHSLSSIPPRGSSGRAVAVLVFAAISRRMMSNQCFQQKVSSAIVGGCG